MSPRGRGRLSTALVVAASVLLLAATLVTYARRTVFNSGQFADRASVALHDPRVRTLAAEHVTDRLVLRAEPDLIAGAADHRRRRLRGHRRPRLRSLFHRAVLDAHRALFARDQDTITLTLADVATVVRAAARGCARSSPTSSTASARSCSCATGCRAWRATSPAPRATPACSPGC